MSNIDIQALAKKAGIWPTEGVIVPSMNVYRAGIAQFADLYREALFAALLAGSGKPVAWLVCSMNSSDGSLSLEYEAAHGSKEQK